MRIAVYAIALNEAKHVNRWVEATKDADFRLVADTGSTDGTPDMLRKHGVTVYDIFVSPWRFDVARNTALSLLPQDIDVCLILDMDEIPEDGFFDKVREQWTSTANRGWVGLNTGNIWAADRLHSRQGFVWRYPCHEVAVPSMGTQAEYCVIDDALIEHKPDNEKSRGQYLAMLEAGHREMPYDHRMIVYLCREYFFKGMWQELIDTGKKLLNVPDGWFVERAQTWRGIGQAYVELGDKEEGLKWFLKGVEEAPNDLEAWFPLAHFYYQNALWQECHDAAAKILELPEAVDRHYISDQSMPWRMYDLLGIACWNLGKKGSAKKYSRMAMELNPDDQRLRDNYDFIVKQTVKDYKDGVQDGLSNTGL
jgi:glycosyltransferase involved in cell wall biosynthesis